MNEERLTRTDRIIIPCSHGAGSLSVTAAWSRRSGWFAATARHLGKRRSARRAEPSGADSRPDSQPRSDWLIMSPGSRIRRRAASNEQPPGAEKILLRFLLLEIIQLAVVCAAQEGACLCMRVRVRARPRAPMSQVVTGRAACNAHAKSTHACVRTASRVGASV